MTQELHLSDQVEIITDSFASLGAPRGSIGVIVDDWADGSNDVEVSDPKTGEVVARFRAAEDEVRPYSGPFSVREPRRHGIIFGRGGQLDRDVEEPPMRPRLGAQIAGYGGAPIAFGAPPDEEVTLEGEIPWELRDEPPTGPIFH
jgi:hypothetical protein